MKKLYPQSFFLLALLININDVLAQAEIANPNRRTAWWTVGNSATTNPATPAVYGTSQIGLSENFAGTIDAQDFVLATDRTERMRLKNTTGYVGIGTATPATRLHVFGGGSTSIDLTVNGRIVTGDAAGNGGVWLSTGTNAFVGNFNTAFGFWTPNAVSQAAFQILKSNGYAGFGTYNPQAPLQLVTPSTGYAAIQDYGSNYTGMSFNNVLTVGGYNIMSGVTDPNLYLNRPTARDIYFRMNNADQMRLSSGANLRIGSMNYSTTAPVQTDDANTKLSVTSGFSSFGSYNNDVAVNAAKPAATWINGVGSCVIGMNRNAGTSGVDFWNSSSHNQAAATGNTDRGFYFRRNNNAGAEQLLGRIEGDGRFYGTSFTNVSDARMKRNFAPYEPVLNRVMQIKAYRYTLLDQSFNEKSLLQFSDVATSTDIGFVAQEVYGIFPEVVHKPKEESKELWGIDYAKFSVILLQAVQEQQLRIQELEKKLEQLNNSLSK